MKFLNCTKNSVYLEDIDMHVPYVSDTEEHYICLDDLKKSYSFQNMIVCGAFSIASHDNSRIENNLARLAKDRSTVAVEKEEEEIMPSGTDPEVIVKGHFYEAGGYAKVNRNLAMGLSVCGVNTQIQPISSRHNDLNEAEIRILSKLKAKVGSKAIRIDSIIPTFGEISPRASYRILYTTVEASTVPEQITKVCDQYDEVWVTSDFCKDVLSKSGVKRPIYVVPPGIQTSLYNEKAEPHVFRPALKPFVFCSVFGWSYRKGYDALLKSYIQTFNEEDPVSLLIVSRYQYASERSGIIKTEIDKYIKQSGKKNPPHIVRCSRVIPEYEMPKIYRACNAFVLPSRGEGFGLPFAEASLCGLPCIATNHSGHTMFLKGHNSVLVDIDKTEKVQRGTMHVHYWDEQVFPSLKSQSFIDNFGGAMRDVFDFYDEAKYRNSLLQKEILERYSFKGAAMVAKNRIEEIWNQLK